MRKVFQKVLEAGFAIVIAQVICSLPGFAQDSTPTFKTLYSFTGPADGRGNPLGQLAVTRADTLYGATNSGGSASLGSVYHLAPTRGGWIEEVLYSFTGGADGNDAGGVIRSATGVLYGTVAFGGLLGGGVAYSLTPPATTGGQWTFAAIHSFGGPLDGVEPAGGMALGTDGSLYGATYIGGAFNSGAIYRLVPPAVAGQPWSESILYSFTGAADGNNPTGVTLAPDGAIYGTTQYGGSAGAGAVFRLSPPNAQNTGWTMESLYSFLGGSDGTQPLDTVILDSAGSLYGVTYSGGLKGAGIAYKLTPPVKPATVWTETILYSFGQYSGDAVNPTYKPTLGKGGVVLGTSAWTPFPLTNATVYMLTPPTSPGGAWTETILHTFTGDYPTSSLTVGASGELFGTTATTNFVSPGGTVYIIR